MSRKYVTPGLKPLTDQELKKRFEEKPLTKQGQARIKNLKKETVKAVDEYKKLYG
ncbi:MAG: hypothetical protein OEV66_12015 [Spirochaetia bacterium]|nr:hypothetical protein [Spirochaetia bacterium]